MRNIAIGSNVYDCYSYREGKVKEYDAVNGIVKIIDEYYNSWSVKEEYVYSVNEDLSQQYNIMICDEHNKDIDYPYYIPIADENAYDFELEHFSQTYS